MNNFNQDISKIRELIGENLSQIPNSDNRLFDEEETNHIGSNFEEYVLRNEFTRDADRILYSKAFRRLEHKAQVYSNKKGDHYRTRLTHTLEVTQISRSIARNLNLNENLTEAIALGHDIGHTPFGHAGEEVLDNIMRGEDNLGGKLKFEIDYGGFKHNFNCLKILEIVEKREKKTGLNLTWQTLEGILKHTKIVKNGKKWDLRRFTRDVNKYQNIVNYLYFDEDSFPKYEFPLTLEGQVVAISDEIAQREHDLDDSLRNGALFRFEEMSKKINNMLNEINGEINTNYSGHELFIEFYNKILEMGEIENTIQWKELTSIIISYFIIDITENTLKNLYDYAPNFEEILYVDEKNNRYIVEKIVKFSESAQKVNDKIKNFIEKRIINSFEVNRFDGKGKFILRQLFKAYYENPRQMPKKQLVVLVKNIQKIIQDYPQLKEEFEDVPVDFTELFRIDENYVDLNNLQPILNILKLDNYSEFSENKELNFELSELLNNISGIMNFNITEEYKKNYDVDEIIYMFFENLFIFCNVKTYEEINNFDNNVYCKNFLLLIKGWNELHYAYLSTICDYISQMTDDYAIKEYHELYLE